MALVEQVVTGPAVPAQLDALHAALDRLWAEIEAMTDPQPSTEQRMAFATGVIEIASNILRHAYPSSASVGDIEIRLELHANRLEALLTDCGQPFTEPRPDSLVEPQDLPESGLGLALARRSLDTVEYERNASGRNQWRLTKYL